jgi:epoxyqueuosine reductase
MDQPDDLKEQIQREAEDCGVKVLGFTTCEPFEADISRFESLESLFTATGQGHTEFSQRQFKMRLYPRNFYPSAQTIIVAAEPIAPGNTTSKAAPGKPLGIRATNYSRAGKGWYDVLEAKMERLAKAIRAKGYTADGAYGYVFRDKFLLRPRYSLLVRAAAVRAGIAQWGKNTLVHNRKYGSFIVLSALYTNAVVPPDPPSDPESDCRSCHACQDACPVNALETPYVLDVTRCVASLHDEIMANPRLPISEEKRRSIANYTSGCDICQSVCPKNKRLPQEQHDLYAELDPDLLHPDLLKANAQEWTPSWREPQAKAWNPRKMINLGNLQDPEGIEPLATCLRDRSNGTLVAARIYAAWALGRIPSSRSMEILRTELEEETDELVRHEIVGALRKRGLDI